MLDVVVEVCDDALAGHIVVITAAAVTSFKCIVSTFCDIFLTLSLRMFGLVLLLLIVLVVNVGCRYVVVITVPVDVVVDARFTFSTEFETAKPVVANESPCSCCFFIL